MKKNSRFVLLTVVNSLLREAKLFDAKLGPIDGAGNVGSHLIGLVVSKTVAEPKAEQSKPEAKQEVESKQKEEKGDDKVETESDKKANGDVT
jgi:vacuolar protein sorting-associated protein 54